MIKDSTVNDLRRGIAEYHSAKTPEQKRFSKRVIEIILWENKEEIVEALMVAERIKRQS